MRILVLTAATGGGHIRAASAVEQYIKGHTDNEVQVLDAMKAIGKVFDDLICGNYLFMARNVPAMFGRMYRTTNNTGRLSNALPKLLGLFSRRLYPAIKEFAPDAIISTHPLVLQIVAHLKRRGQITAPLLSIVTDYGLHKAYVAPQVDGYIAGSAHMLPEFLAMGVEKEKVHDFGIPVHEEFFAKADKDELLSEMGLTPGLPTVLFMAGSFGVSNIIGLYKSFIDADMKAQLIIITGRNEKLYRAFEKEIGENPAMPTKLIMFTDEVEKYMKASDLLVTKPGGLTVSEALACGLPMAAFDAIPGQEEDNARFLSENDMCLRLTKESDFAGEICGLMGDKERLERMRRNCEAFDKSACVPNMLKLIEELITEKA